MYFLALPSLLHLSIVFLHLCNIQCGLVGRVGELMACMVLTGLVLTHSHGILFPPSPFVMETDMYGYVQSLWSTSERLKANVCKLFVSEHAANNIVYLI